VRVDERSPEVDYFLQNFRRRLNLRFLVGEALAAWLVASVPALVPGLLLGSSPLPLRLIACAGTCALACVSFLIVRWPRRLSTGQAALWLDETQQTNGLFRAAVDGLASSKRAYSEEWVLNQARRQADLLVGTKSLRLPRKRLVFRGVAAVALAVVSVFVLQIKVAPTIKNSKEAETQATAPDAAQTPNFFSQAPSRITTPQEAARRLFPENPRLSALAEQALASGDEGALKSLLDQNATPQETQPGAGQAGGKTGSSGSGDGPNGQPGTPMPGEQGEGSGEGSAKATDRGGSSQPGGGSGSPSPGKAGEGSGQASGPPSGPGSGAGAGSQDRSAYNLPGSGGAAGNGHSDQALGRHGPTPSSDRRMVVPQPGNPGIFEFVLPGSDSRMPLSQALAGSKRSAETALDRSSPPVEFETTVRDYFLTLSREVTR